MKREELHEGMWIIWDGDTYPRPWQLYKENGEFYTNANRDELKDFQIEKARPCTQEEIPEEYRTNIETFPIY